MSELWQICFDQLVETDELECVDWGSEVSLYNSCSGETLLLNLFPYEILQFLLLKPAPLSAVAEHMAVLCDEENNKKWHKKVLILLQQLKELELVDYQN